jgi:hypothetical protein
MVFHRGLLPNYFGWIIVCLVSLILPVIAVNTVSAQDSTKLRFNDSLHYPIHDSRGDFFSAQKSPFDLKTPSNITDSIQYDPVTKRYVVYEKIGDRYYRTPTSYTSEEFMEMEGHKA